jgi:hypothetical protein
MAFVIPLSLNNSGIFDFKRIQRVFLFLHPLFPSDQGAEHDSARYRQDTFISALCPALLQP